MQQNKNPEVSKGDYCLRDNVPFIKFLKAIEKLAPNVLNDLWHDCRATFMELLSLDPLAKDTLLSMNIQSAVVQSVQQMLANFARFFDKTSHQAYELVDSRMLLALSKWAAKHNLMCLFNLLETDEQVLARSIWMRKIGGTFEVLEKGNSDEEWAENCHDWALRNGFELPQRLKELSEDDLRRLGEVAMPILFEREAIMSVIRNDEYRGTVEVASFWYRLQAAAMMTLASWVPFADEPMEKKWNVGLFELKELPPDLPKGFVDVSDPNQLVTCSGPPPLVELKLSVPIWDAINESSEDFIERTKAEAAKQAEYAIECITKQYEQNRFIRKLSRKWNDLHYEWLVLSAVLKKKQTAIAQQCKRVSQTVGEGIESAAQAVIGPFGGREWLDSREHGQKKEAVNSPETPTTPREDNGS